MTQPAPEPAITATMKTFGYPETLIADYTWWSVLLRPKQVTYGSLILAAKANVTALSDLTAAAFSELAVVTSAIEQSLAAAIKYEKINYLALMMVDPEPHFHVIPRYRGTRTMGDLDFPDTGWPGPPALNDAIALSAAQSSTLRDALASHWPNTGTLGETGI